MAGTYTADIPSLTEAGVDLIFNRSARAQRDNSFPKISTQLTNQKETGIYQTLGALGPAEVRPEGDAFNYDRIQEY